VTFSEFAQMLYPFYGNGRYPSDLVVALVGNIIEDTEDESCSLLDKRPEYLTRIYNGDKAFPKGDASFVLSHLDRGKFESFLTDTTDDTIDMLCTTLSGKGIVVPSKYDVASTCTDVG